MFVLFYYLPSPVVNKCINIFLFLLAINYLNNMYIYISLIRFIMLSLLSLIVFGVRSNSIHYARVNISFLLSCVYICNIYGTGNFNIIRV